jgi:hypothetical protein
VRYKPVWRGGRPQQSRVADSVLTPDAAALRYLPGAC